MFNCIKCNKICKSKGGLTKHLKICENENNEDKQVENNSCKYCNKNFFNCYSLKRQNTYHQRNEAILVSTILFP